MKRLITIFAVISLACLGAGGAYAESSPPAGYDIIDWVNIGDETSEAGPPDHNLDEWSDAINPHWSGMPDGIFRQIWGPDTPATPGMLVEDFENWATIELDFTKSPNSGQRYFGFYYLAGAGLDNFYVDINVTGDDPDLGYIRIAEVEEFESSNTMVRVQLAVPDWVPAGVHTVKLECSEPAWGSNPGAGQWNYGQVTFDEIYTFTEGPAITPVAVDTNPISCDGDKIVNFHYIPDDAPPVRGYSVRVQSDTPLIIEDYEGNYSDLITSDIIMYDVATGGTPLKQVVEVTAGFVYDIDYAIGGTTSGIVTEADLFSMRFHGDADGLGTVEILSVEFRGLDNTPIPGVYFSGTASIDVDCTAPDIPVMDAEDTYTIGLTNTVSWSDVSASGATFYYAECATDAGFTNVVGNSGWTALLTKEFDSLLDGQIYHYRVKSKDALDNESDWSGAVFSTQDNIAPESSVDALATYQTSLTFDVAYTASDATSGVSSVRLFYQVDGGGFVEDTNGPYSVNPISFTAPNDGEYGFYTMALDGVGNEETAAGSADASTIVDTTAPATKVTALGALHVDSFFDVFVEIELEDGSGVASMGLYYKKEGDPGYTFYDNFVDVLTPLEFDTGPLPDGTGTGDGTYYFYSIGLDNAPNTEDPPIDPNGDTSTTVDTTAPDGVAGLTGDRGNDKVHLSWTNPTVDLAGVEVWRAVWHTGDDVTSAYPEYDDHPLDAIPDGPTDHAAAVSSDEWTMIYEDTTDPFDASLSDPATRGIYYYVVYTVDGGGLYGPGAEVSSINYLLGDINADGDVTAGPDISALGDAYGTSDGPYPYNNNCDVGPTDDFSGAGIPETDNEIGFEDLMIFALNWDVLPLTKAPQTEGGPVARFSWIGIDNTTWALTLTEPCANLKGVNLKANLPQDGVVSLVAGELLQQQSQSYFLRNIPSKGLDAGLAVLGGDVCITGRGELLRIEFDEEFDVGNIEITARDAANKDLEFTLEEATPGSDTPTRYMVSANYPNPFNPSTKIDFALPEPQHVKLMIFGIDGRLVTTLRNEPMSAGHYTETWMGRDDKGNLVASGIYFYRIQAGDFSRIQKMTLLK